MTRFLLTATHLAGLTLMQRYPIGDERGYLERLFCQDDLATVLKGKTVAQINHTLTARTGTVRGLHFQHPPHAEIKFVSCLKGAVYDVAVDLRHGSPTVLHWHAEILSADNYKTLVIPQGFAHGFQTLTDDCEMLYLHTAAYSPAAEGGLHAEDPCLGIGWPLPITEMSASDRGRPRLDAEFDGLNT